MRILIISVIAICFFASCNSNAIQQKEFLPYLGEKKIIETAIDGKIVLDTLYYTIPAFSFTNHEGDQITNKDVRGKIYVADFFFTSCPTICPVMKKNMLKVYEHFKGNENVTILSHTIDPRNDDVALLDSYAKKLGVSAPGWNFLTGELKELHGIARAYLASVLEDDKAPGGFIHSGSFLLIDKQGRIRGHYDGTEADQVMELIADMEFLLNEYE